MLKKMVLGVGVAAFVCASAASANEVRPSAAVLAPAVAQSSAFALPAPSKARVRKSNEALPTIAIVLLVTAVVGGTIAAASSGGSSSPR